MNPRIVLRHSQESVNARNNYEFMLTTFNVEKRLTLLPLQRWYWVGSERGLLGYIFKRTSGKWYWGTVENNHQEDESRFYSSRKTAIAGLLEELFCERI